jgi:hypothetical protein
MELPTFDPQGRCSFDRSSYCGRATSILTPGVMQDVAQDVAQNVAQNGERVA